MWTEEKRELRRDSQRELRNQISERKKTPWAF